MTVESPPVLLTLHRSDRFSSIWLKGIRAVNLETHCISTFAGRRHQVDRNAAVQTIEIRPAKRDTLLYLCGVTWPGGWSRNAHLAMRLRAGAEWSGDALVPDLQVEVVGAEPVFGWGEHDVPPEHPMYGDRLYRTCRNLQFGWFVHRELGVPLRPPMT